MSNGWEMAFHIRKTNGQLRSTLIVIKDMWVKKVISYTDNFLKIKTQYWWEYRKEAFFSPAVKSENKVKHFGGFCQSILKAKKIYSLP